MGKMRGAALVTVFFLGAAAQAHDTWVLPSAFRVKPGDPLRLDLSSGMGFPKLENPVMVARVARASYRLGGARYELGGLVAGASSLVVTKALPKEGVATVSFDLKPKEIELSDAEVAEYLDEIAATQEIRSAWAARGGKTPWRETYTKHAKTFVASGSVEGDSSWKDPVGSALELVPKSSPFEVATGGKLTVRLLSGARPVAGVPVGLLVAGADGRAFQTTDRMGEATFTMTRPGRALLFVVRLSQTPDRKSWESDFATLTLEVGE